MDRQEKIEVMNYLNNKFGNDFTQTEPWPEWMRQERVPMTDTACKCRCEAEDDLLQQVANEAEEGPGKLVGYLRAKVVNDDVEERNVIVFYYEEV